MLLGFETLNLKICDLKLWKLTVRPISPLTLHPASIVWLHFFGESPMGLGIPPLEIKIMLESNPPKSTMLVGRLGILLWSTESKRPVRSVRELRIWIPEGLTQADLSIYLSIYLSRGGVPKSTGNSPEIRTQRFFVCGFSVCGLTERDCNTSNTNNTNNTNNTTNIYIYIYIYIYILFLRQSCIRILAVRISIKISGQYIYIYIYMKYMYTWLLS